MPANAKSLLSYSARFFARQRCNLSNQKGPAIVQADRSILLEVDHPDYEAARDALAAFAELVKSPEHIHTYRITPLSLWNAAATGLTIEQVMGSLERFSRYEIPEVVSGEIIEYMGRYGRLTLDVENGKFILRSKDELLLKQIASHKLASKFFEGAIGTDRLIVAPAARGFVKQALVKIGFPVDDIAGYTPGTKLDISLRETTKGGQPFGLRKYQTDSAAVFHAGGGSRGGSGVIVLPCGAGKTIVGIATMALVQANTLILTANVVAVRQWIRELLDKTNLKPEQVAEYTGDNKGIAPVTVATYQIVTYRKRKSEEFPHFSLFSKGDWGLIIYDEVHLLPAPVFRATATLVREDGLEEDVFSLVGPKRYDVPWRVLEKQGWIATADCTEVRVEMPSNGRLGYAVADMREQYRLAAENPRKLDVLEALLKIHKDDHVLIIAQYLDQLHGIAERFGIPVIEGKTPVKRREELYAKFRSGEVNPLLVSKVGNFAIDLPEANVLIQLSGTFGSRQEEAQRLGRILRPYGDNLAHFYTLVTRETRDQDFGAKRQLFLVEQGYHYRVVESDDVLAGTMTVDRRTVPAGSVA
jgi:DNA excision repair protein ERCC-3